MAGPTFRQALVLTAKANGSDITSLTVPGSIIKITAELAILIIGIMVAAGVLRNLTMGWVAIGLMGGLFVLEGVALDCKKRTFEFLIAGLQLTVMVAVGILGRRAILSTPQVGLGIVCAQITGCVFVGYKIWQNALPKALAQWGAASTS